ncbi:hypothetical protein R1flu_005554 [Riccia fluitans]|uniref:Uncharacterized protein n=1 Tax=Riccia fluitans TaxID=41844 RepID=A0ABD1YUA6_9MARC
MTIPKTATAATKVEETKAAKDIATLPIAVSVVGSTEATKEVAGNGKDTHAANGTLTFDSHCKQSQESSANCEKTEARSHTLGTANY